MKKKNKNIFTSFNSIKLKFCLIINICMHLLYTNKLKLIKKELD